MAILEARQLTKNFDGLEAVKDFNLQIDKGQFIGLIGPNGAGKTTTFNLLTGVLQPSKGQVLIDGIDVTNSRPDRIIRHGITRTFQSVRIFSDFSVEDNLRLACYSLFNYRPIEGLLGFPIWRKKESELTDYISGLMNTFNLSAYSKSRAGQLPYVTQRWIELCRAMAIKPRILLLDEPTAGMSTQEMQEYIDKVQMLRHREGLSILLIEHDMQLVMDVCETLVVMDHGSVIAHGSPEEIQENPLVIEAYLGGKNDA